MRMKKNLYLTILFLYLTPFLSSAQFNNPFEFDPRTYNSQDIMILWSDPQSSSTLNQQVLGFDWTGFASQPDPFSFFEQTPVITDDIAGMSNPAKLATVSGDINGDAFDDILIAFKSGSNVKYVLSNKTVNVEEGTVYRDITIEPPFESEYGSFNIGNASGNERNLIEAISGDFDGDGTAEFAIIAGDSDQNKIVIQLLDSDGTLNLNQRGSIRDEDLVATFFDSSEGFSAASADVNGDGKDEIVLTGVENNTTGSGQYATFLKIYEVTAVGSSNIEARGRITLEDSAIEQVVSQQNTNFTYTQNAVTPVQSSSDTKSTLVAGLAIGHAINDNDVHNFYFYHVSVSDDLNTLTVADEVSFFHNFVTSDGQSAGLPLLGESGDLNGDGMEEAVFFSSADLFVMAVNPEDNTLTYESSQGLGNTNELQESNSNFAVGDITKNGRADVVTMHKFLSGQQNEFSVRSFETPADSYNLNQISEFSFEDESGFSYRAFALDLGNYDGDDFFLGEGTLHQCDYYMPVMIVGAPPVHWDMINDEVYDINNCFGTGTCDFGAIFSQSTTDEFITSVELNSDWAVSSGVSAGGGAFGVSVSASVEARYGEQFSNLQESSVVIEQKLTSEAKIDDKVHFFRIPVDVWEYPVYDAAGEIVDYVLGVFPTQTSNDNIVVNISTTKALGNYRPHHEPGNILSYPDINSIQDYPDFPESAGPDAIIFDGLANIGFSVSGSNNLSLSYQETFGETNTSSWQSGVSTSFSVSGWGLGFNLDAEYNQGAVNISSKSVSSTTGFDFSIGNILGPDGEYNYSAQPLIYWSQDGTGILTYKVTPLTGDLGTFWEDNYSQLPDPALNLPWKNDVIHSNLDPSDDKVDRTKSLFFSKPAPLPDDTVTVFATVMNYSLKATEQPVEMQFYAGNPDENGILLTDINGESLFSTQNSLAARGRETVEMDFIFTLDFYQTENLEIFVVIDPDDKIAEIHDDNNQGWGPLGLSCGGEVITSVEEMKPDDFSEETLQINTHPNPSDGEVNIVFQLSQFTEVSVRILDLSGKVVKEVVESNMPPGEIRIFTDISNLPSGMYITEVVTDNTKHSRKIMKQ